MKHKELPTEKTLKKLPRWARIALVVRSLRRVMPLMFELLPDSPNDFWQLLEWAAQVTEHSAETGTPHDDLLQLWNQLLCCSDPGTTDTWYVEDQEIERAAASVVLSAWNSKVEAAAEALEQLECIVTCFEVETKRRGVEKHFIHGVWSDMEIVSKRATEERWSDRSGVAGSIFGELWPHGRPKGWATDDRVIKLTTSSDRSFSRSHQNAIAKLPKELVRFLEQNPNHVIRSKSLDCGIIALHKVDFLQMGEHEFTLSMSDWAKDDPNRRVPGRYVLNTIDLVCYCQEESPVGQLVWMVDYECFGCHSDEEDGFVNLFVGTSWEEILARPAFFINSRRWGATKPVVELTTPWERLKYRKIKPPEELVPVLESLRAIDRSHSSKAFSYLSDLIRSYFKNRRSPKIKQLCDAYEELTDSELFIDLLEAISCRPISSAEEFVRELAIYFKGTKSDFDACRLADAMLGLCFDKTKRFPVKAGLNPSQRDVLTCLLRRKSLWSREPELSDLMKEHGLPNTYSKLESMLKHIGDTST